MSIKNKTINTSVEDGQEYLSRCIEVNTSVELDSVLDKTIHGDTFLVCPHLPRESIDLIIVDPPYNLSKKYGDTQFSEMDGETYVSFTKRWLAQMCRLLKSNGSIYVCCDWKSSLVIGRLLGLLFEVRSRITWGRDKGRGASNNWKNNLEDIWFATKSNTYTFNSDDVKMRRKVLAPYHDDLGSAKGWNEQSGQKFRDTCPSNFWDDITIPFWSMPENTAHPTQKPEKLVAKLILASSNKNDVVFDPFLGSGTTSVVAKKLGRHYIGVEQEAQYCVWSEQRLELANIDKRIQGYEDGIFWERNSRPSRTEIQSNLQVPSVQRVHKFC